MKIEIGDKLPGQFPEYWPGQYEIFSHFEYVAGVPAPMFLVTTLKENGKPNVGFESWSCFGGDKGGYFVVMQGVMRRTHTFRNILRDGEFCVNFVAPEYYDGCYRTVQQNGDDIDEIAAGGFTPEAAATIRPPRIHEAFLCMECVFEWERDLSGAGINALVVGRVKHAAVEEGYHAIERICGPAGFMYNVHSPKEPRSGTGKRSAVAVLGAHRLIDE